MPQSEANNQNPFAHFLRFSRKLVSSPSKLLYSVRSTSCFVQGVHPDILADNLGMKYLFVCQLMLSLWKD
ncbi:hypothetical protein RJT34_25510 [Clitoria ternatea]|uniref:Uncharacterized protein n=1 Tax=Clitoria ternatea TaxID=43366 RepID=A0AAN9FSU1_CLITE